MQQVEEKEEIFEDWTNEEIDSTIKSMIERNAVDWLILDLIKEQQYRYLEMEGIC